MDRVSDEVSKSLTDKKAASRLFAVYKDLMEYGFPNDKIEQAIRNMPQVISVDSWTLNGGL